MTVTEAIDKLHKHYAHRFSIVLEVLVDKHGKTEIEWTVYDPVHVVRKQACDLATTVALAIDRPDTLAAVDAAVAGLDDAK